MFLFASIKFLFLPVNLGIVFPAQKLLGGPGKLQLPVLPAQAPPSTPGKSRSPLSLTPQLLYSVV